MAQEIILNTKSLTTARILEDYILLGRKYKPSWFNTAPARKCPGMRDMFNNSIVLLSPTDIEIVYEEGRAMVKTACDSSDEYFKLVKIGHNSREESGDLYDFLGDVLQFKVEYQAFMTPTPEESLINIVSVPPIYYMKDILKPNNPLGMLALPGLIQVSHKFPLEPICMMIMPKKPEGTRIVLKKGTPLGMYYFPDGLSKLTIKDDLRVTPPTRTSFNLGSSYNDAIKLSKCPMLNTKGVENE